MKDSITTLLTVNAFSEEATSMVIKNQDRYLPILATLANYSAKNIDVSFYDLKDEMLDEVASISTNMGWKTFQSMDETPCFPYIFYVETGYAPQVSFHSDKKRKTNFTGSWSKISVQEIAPKLVHNLLKKDGFRGRAFCNARKIVNMMKAAGAGETGHLHKGTTFYFSVNEDDELVVRVNGEPVEASVSTLQSFATRLAKQEQARPFERESDGEEECANELNPTSLSPGANQGTSEEGGDAEAQPETSLDPNKSEGDEFNFPESESGSSEQVDSEASNGSSVDLSSKGLAEQADGAGDSDTKNPADEELELDPRGSDPSDSHLNRVKGAINSQADGFYELVKGLKAKSNGGGRQLDVDANASKAKVDVRIQDALQSVANTPSFQYEKSIAGRYDNRAVVKALLTKAHSLPAQRKEPKKDVVYFSVDTSGSVATFGNFIISMIKSASSSENITVYSGGEALPQKNEKTGKRIIESYEYDFSIAISRFVQVENPPDGATIVFWGDLQMLCEINANSLLNVTKKYKCIWLHCHDLGSVDFHYTKKYIAALKAAKFKIIPGVSDVKSFANALKNI